MTRTEALQKALDCLKRVEVYPASQTPEHNKASGLRMQALAEAGKAYIELAKLLDNY